MTSLDLGVELVSAAGAATGGDRRPKPSPIITGTVNSARGGGLWILTGSYIQSRPADPWIYELTATNANGTGQAGFVSVFKLKGVQPQGRGIMILALVTRS